MTQPKLIDLRKDIKIVLEKKSAPKICVQVGSAKDISGSAEPIYRGGENSVMEEVVSRSFAVAMEFDDNATLDSWAFHTRTYELEPVVESMFGHYVAKHVLEALGNELWGGTAFVPLVETIVSHYYPDGKMVEVEPAVYEKPGFMGKLFGKEPKLIKPARMEKQAIGRNGLKLVDPAYVMIYTDGENSDQSQTERAFKKYENHQVFFMFIGVNSGQRANFGFIERMAKQFKNVGFFDANKIQELSNQQLYAQLVSDKFIGWYKSVKA